MVKPRIIIYDKRDFTTNDYSLEMNRDDVMSSNILLIADKENNTFDVIRNRWDYTRPKNVPMEQLSEFLNL